MSFYTTRCLILPISLGFPGGSVAQTVLPMLGGLGSIPGQGARTHKPQLRV